METKIQNLENELRDLKQSIQNAEKISKINAQSNQICQKGYKDAQNLAEKIQNSNDVITARVNKIMEDLQKIDDNPSSPNQDGTASISKEEALRIIDHEIIQKGVLEKAIKNYADNTNIRLPKAKKAKKRSPAIKIIAILLLTAAVSYVGYKYYMDNFTTYEILVKERVTFIQLGATKKDIKRRSLRKTQKITNAKKVLINGRYYYDFNIGDKKMRIRANKVKVTK